MYAADTDVPVGRTRQSIEDLLRKAKCTQFMVANDEERRRALVQFKVANRIVRFEIDTPDPNDRAFTHDRRGIRRAQSSRDAAVAQGERQRWRALFLVIKAKLEAVESRITTFEQEFLAHIVLPDDRTVGDHVLPKVEAAYAAGDARKLLQDVTP